MRKLFLIVFICLSVKAWSYDFYAGVDGIYYYFDETTKTAEVGDCLPQKYKGDIVIPELVVYSGDNYTVTGIGDEAFASCSDLTSVYIPNSVVSIGHKAFYYCSDLTSVRIPNSVTSIGNYAFKSCSNLMSLNIPSSLISIGENAFDGCKIKSIDLPASVTSIGEYALDSYGLESINVSADNTMYSSENGVLYNKDKSTLLLYPRAKQDVSFVIPNTVTNIKAHAFYNCDYLKNVTISSPCIKSIEGGAFTWCELETLSIFGYIEKIDQYAFSNTEILKLYIYYKEKVLSIPFRFPIYMGGPAPDRVLYVPRGMRKQYIGYSNYFTRIEEMSAEMTGVDNVADDTKSAEIKQCYDVNGRMLNGMNKGLNIIRYSDGTVRKVVKK